MVSVMPADTTTGNPGPLGLAAFSLSTVLLSLVNAGLFGIELEMALIPLAFVFGGVVQVLVGMLEYREGNTFGLTAFTSYGAFWMWFGLLVTMTHNGLLPSVGARALGMVLLVWGVFTVGMWISTFKLNWALWSVFLLLSVTFFLLAFGDLLGMASLTRYGGYLGLVTGAGAFYVSIAEVTNWSFDGEVLPLGGQPLASKPTSRDSVSVADD